MKSLIERDLRTLIGDLQNQAHLRELEIVVNDRSRRNLDLLAEELLSYSRIKGRYDSIRYIDESGMERVKILMGRKGPYIVDEKDLQIKKSRYYFLDTMKLDKEQVYISRFDLKMEHGRVEIPYRPDIRLAVPLFSKDGKRRGIFVLNYMGSRLLKEDIDDVCDDSLCKTFLLNSDGYFMRGPRPEDEWGFMFGEKKELTFSRYYNREWQIISGRSSSSFFTDKGFFSHETISLSNASPEGVSLPQIKDGDGGRWILVSHIPAENLFPEKRKLLPRLGLLFILLVSGAWWISHLIAIKGEREKVAEEALKETLFEIHTILSTAEVGIFHLRDGGFVWINDKMQEQFGYERDELVGGSSDMLHLFPADQELMNAQAFACFKNGNTFRADHLLKKKDGTLFWCHIIARAIDPDLPEKGSIWITEDISEAKKYEDDILKAKEEAEAALKIKDKFVSLVSHDLKGPITVLKGYMEILRDGKANMETLVPEISREALECCDSMTKLINDILTLSRIKQGGIHPIISPVDLKLVIETVLKKYKPLAHNKGILIINEVGSGLTIRTDERLIEEVLANLVSNAVKFCRNGDEVRIIVPEGLTGTIAVRDTGVGIPPERFEKLFRYEEKTSTYGTSGESGTGFGLPLVRDIMRALGGNVTIESEVGKGSTFYIHLS